jgi:MFS family permease
LPRRSVRLQSLALGAVREAFRLHGARAVLADGRFRLLFLATLGSGIGNWLAVIALQVDVYDRTHSGWWVAALLMANILPAVFIGLLLGPLFDSLSRKWLMIGSDLVRLAVFATLPFVGSASAIVLLAAVAGIGMAFFRPAVLAGLPNLVDDERLPIANALLQLVEWTTIAVGPLLGGALTAASGPDLAYWVNAVTFGLSAALVAFIPRRLLQSERRIGSGHWHDLAEGFRVVRASPGLMTVLVAWSIAMVASALINVAEVFLAKEAYGAGDFGFGLLWAGTGVGLVLGGIAAGTLLAGSLSGVYVRMLLVFAAGIGAAGIVPTVWLGALAMVVAGFANGGAVVANITFVQRGAADRVRGRAFTVIMSANYAVLGVALVSAGPITNAVGPRWVYALAAVTLLAAAAVAWRLTRGVEQASGLVKAA